MAEREFLGSGVLTQVGTNDDTRRKDGIIKLLIPPKDLPGENLLDRKWKESSFRRNGISGLDHF